MTWSRSFPFFCLGCSGCQPLLQWHFWEAETNWNWHQQNLFEYGWGRMEWQRRPSSPLLLWKAFYVSYCFMFFCCCGFRAGPYPIHFSVGPPMPGAEVHRHTCWWLFSWLSLRMCHSDKSMPLCTYTKHVLTVAVKQEDPLLCVAPRTPIHYYRQLLVSSFLLFTSSGGHIPQGPGTKVLEEHLISVAATGARLSDQFPAGRIIEW